MKVDRSRIIDEALALLNEVGVDALSTRLLAQRLGVQQPALYWHFRNKRALLDAMNGEILARGHLHQIPRPGEDWRGFFLANAHSFRAALLAYRDGARVHAGTEAQPEEVGQHEQQLRIFVDAGFPVGEAMELLVAVGRYTVGCVLEEQTQALQGSEPQAVLDAAAAPSAIRISPASNSVAWVLRR